MVPKKSDYKEERMMVVAQVDHVDHRGTMHGMDRPVDVVIAAHCG